MPFLSIFLFSRAYGVVAGGVIFEWVGDLFHMGPFGANVVFLGGFLLLSPMIIIFAMILDTVSFYFRSSSLPHVLLEEGFVNEDEN